jgi:hypothetical protein
VFGEVTAVWEKVSVVVLIPHAASSHGPTPDEIISCYLNPLPFHPLPLLPRNTRLGFSKYNLRLRSISNHPIVKHQLIRARISGVIYPAPNAGPATSLQLSPLYPPLQTSTPSDSEFNPPQYYHKISSSSIHLSLFGVYVVCGVRCAARGARLFT